jgi:hypothetical protein
MRARPVGPAESSALHDFARSGPTKEAHRRALYRSGGLLHSVAGQGHARFLRVTLPRERSDQGKRSEAGSHRYAVGCVPIMVGIAVPIMVGIMVGIVVSDRVAGWRSRNCSSRCHGGGLNCRMQ